MTTITITEALSELKLIDKKVEKKREFIASHIVRLNAMVDPLGDSGGSRKVLEQEQQAVRDLLQRKVSIRRAIQTANSLTEITVAGETRTISDWLVWRREVAPLEQTFLRDLKHRIDQARIEATKRNVSLVSAEKTPESLGDVVANVSEKKLSERAEQLETILQTLDGKLSLKNALVTVEV